MNPSMLILGRVRLPFPVRSRAVLTILGVAILAACGSTPPVRYHALSPAAPAASSTGYEGPVIDVAAVQVPPELSRQELVRETAQGRFEVRESDHWAAPLGRLARQALAEDLAARLPPGRVVFPGASWPSAGAVVHVDILSFRVANGQATMVVSWSIRPVAVPTAASAPASSREKGAAVSPGAARGRQLRLETPAQDGADATTQAWNELLGQLADGLALDLGRATGS